MATYKQRLERVERAADPEMSLRVLWVNLDETEDEVLAKAGPYSGRTVLIHWQRGDRDL